MTRLPKHHEYPRMTLRCRCHNEFNVNVMRFKNQDPVVCAICGEIFPPDLGQQLADALHDMFKVRHQLEQVGSGFNLSFVYKSTFKQPPAPLPFDPADFASDDEEGPQRKS
jgi:hypothetical protein